MMCKSAFECRRKLQARECEDEHALFDIFARIRWISLSFLAVQAMQRKQHG